MDLKELTFEDPRAIDLMASLQSALHQKFPNWEMRSLLNSSYFYPQSSQHFVFESMKSHISKKTPNLQSRVFVNPTLTSTLIRISNFDEADLTSLQNFLHSYPFPQGRLHLLGHSVFQEGVRNTSLRDQAILVPFLILALGVFLYFSFRSLATSLLCLAITTLSYLLTAIFAVWLEGSISPFGSLALLLGFIMAITDLTHLFMADEAGQSFWPCFYSSGTTIAAMASLTFTPIMAVRHFGWMGIVSTLVSFILSFYLLPRLLKVFEIKPNIPSIWENTANPIFQFVGRRPLKLIFGFCFFYGGTLLFTKPPPINERMGTQFSENSPFSQAMQALQRGFGFDGEIELVYTPVPQTQNNLLTWYQVDRQLAEDLQALQNTESVLAFSLLSADQTINAPLLNEMDQMGLLKTFKPNFYNEARIKIFLRDSSYAGLERTVEQVEVKMEALKDHFADYHLTGYSYLRFKTLQKLATALSSSLLWSALGIFICIFLMLRSFTLSLLAVIPNLLPLLTIQLAFALANFDMSFYLVMMSVIIIGISDNDTIHYFYHYKTHSHEPIPSILKRVAPPTIVVNLAFIIAFSFLIFSGFRPFREVAAASILTFTVALFSDLLLTTAILTWIRKSQNHVNA